MTLLSSSGCKVWKCLEVGTQFIYCRHKHTIQLSVLPGISSKKLVSVSKQKGSLEATPEL